MTPDPSSLADSLTHAGAFIAGHVVALVFVAVVLRQTRGKKK